MKGVGVPWGTTCWGNGGIQHGGWGMPGHHTARKKKYNLKKIMECLEQPAALCAALCGIGGKPAALCGVEQPAALNTNHF